MKQVQLKNLPAGKLITLKRNPQYMTPAQMESLKASIRRDGFCAPILVRPLRRGLFEVVSGNHRLMAAIELGMKEIPCVIANLTRKQVQRLAINLNTIHGNPNAELLAPFLAELSEDVLREIHIEGDLKKELLDFDQNLADQLKKMEAPSKLDRNSPQHSNATCKCPTCGSVHRRK